MVKATALIAAAALGLAACGSSSGGNTSSGGGTSSSASAGGGGVYGSAGSGSSTTAKASNTAAATGGNTNAVAMKDYSFAPKVITGKAGSTVKIKLTNQGTKEHNFKIDSQEKTGADADVEPGKTATVTVKIPTSGTLQFYCEYHKGLGMVGTVKPS